MIYNARFSLNPGTPQLAGTKSHSYFRRDAKTSKLLKKINRGERI